MFGGIVEKEIFGNMKPENPAEGFPGSKDYVKFNEALRYVRNHQRPGNPENPHEFFPHDLLEYLRTDEELKAIAPEAIYRFDTALGSHLDHFHGIDALIECKPDPKDSRVFIITLDVTTNPGKEGGYKADVVIILDKEGIDPGDTDYRDIVTKYGGEIKDQLLTILPEAVKVKAA